MAEKKQSAAKKPCDMTKLAASGTGLWKYAQEGVTEEIVKDKAFFTEAVEKYGMREGDIVFVNAGGGKAFMVGV